MGRRSDERGGEWARLIFPAIPTSSCCCPPDFRTVSDFRKDNLAAFSDLFLQVLVLCQRAGLVKLCHVALDGTKVRANASKHKAMSYKRMKEEAGRLAAEVAELLRRAQEADDEENRRYGREQRGDELPKELAC